MTEGRCGTCRHWDNRYQVADLANTDILIARGSWVVAHNNRAHDLRDAEFGNCDTLHDNELVKNQDHVEQWWDTPLQTHKTFGCVLWESRDSEPAYEDDE